MKAHVVYSGTVQGVGFRYTTQRLALELNLRGWVRNLSDGRVEIFAEGSEDIIKKLLEHLDQHFDGYIRDKEVDLQKEEAPPEHKDFRIVP